MDDNDVDDDDDVDDVHDVDDVMTSMTTMMSMTSMDDVSSIDRPISQRPLNLSLSFINYLFTIMYVLSIITSNIEQLKEVQFQKSMEARQYLYTLSSECIDAAWRPPSQRPPAWRLDDIGADFTKN